MSNFCWYGSSVYKIAILMHIWTVLSILAWGLNEKPTSLPSVATSYTGAPVYIILSKRF